MDIWSNKVTRYLEYIIPEEYEGRTIEEYLLSKGFGQKTLIELKKTERNAVINDEWVYLSRRLKAGEKLEITISEDGDSEIIPVKLPFKVIYEDEDILIVDKPPMMPIHPSLGNYDNTLANAVTYYFAEKGEKLVFRCVNRLDRDTSGLTIIAKHYLSGAILHNQITQRQIHREYVAIVCGADIEDEGKIDMPIGRAAESVIERRIDYENGQRAITNYKVLERKNGLAKVWLRLETGRTHQIRVHMTAIGHPLIGDWLYNPENHQLNRQALHSYRLCFNHPITGESMDFVSEVPEDMKEAFLR